MHALPQAPQLCWFMAVSTHTPLQLVSPAGQTHIPETHEAPAAQTFPHPPQETLLD